MGRRRHVVAAVAVTVALVLGFGVAAAFAADDQSRIVLDDLLPGEKVGAEVRLGGATRAKGRVLNVRAEGNRASDALTVTIRWDRGDAPLWSGSVGSLRNDVRLSAAPAERGDDTLWLEVGLAPSATATAIQGAPIAFEVLFTLQVPAVGQEVPGTGKAKPVVVPVGPKKPKPKGVSGKLVAASTSPLSVTALAGGLVVLGVAFRPTRSRRADRSPSS